MNTAKGINHSFMIIHDSDCTYVVTFDNYISAYAFFRNVSHELSFGDCTGYEVDKIVWNGCEFEYEGWQSGMVFSFRAIDGEKTLSYCFPEFDH